LAKKEVKIRLSTTGKNKTERDLKGVNRSIGNLAKSALTLAAAYKGVTFALESVKLAGKLKDLETAHKNLAKAQNLNAKTMIEGMQKATKGTVSELDLLNQANNALLLGLPLAEGDMSKLADAGRRLGRAMGIDAAMGLESLVVGIGRQSKLWLDNLGIIVDTDKAYKSHAKSLGKQASALTDAEKKAAFYGATMESIDDKMKQLGEDQETITDKIERAAVQYENAKIKLGAMITPALSMWMENAAEIVSDFTEANTVMVPEVEKVTKELGKQTSTWEFLTGWMKKAKKEVHEFQGFVGPMPEIIKPEDLNIAKELTDEQKKFKEIQDKILLNQAERLIREQALLDLKQRGLVAYTEEELKIKGIFDTYQNVQPILGTLDHDHASIVTSLGEADHLANAVASASARWARESANAKDQIFQAANALNQVIQMATGARKFSLSGLLAIGAGIANLIPGGQGVGLGLGVGATALRGLQGGGHVSAGEPVIVGENRRELFIPDRPGTVVPEVGGNILNITVQGAFVGNIDEFAEEIAARSEQTFNRIAINA